MIFTSCKPSADRFIGASSTIQGKGQEAKVASNLRRPSRSLHSQPQIVQASTPKPSPIFVINKESIPEWARRNALNNKQFHATHKIYYLPIHKNITQRDLDIIEYTLSLRSWITHLPRGVNYSRLYFQQKKELNVNLYEVVSTSIDNAIELNFEDAEHPCVQIHKGDGSEVIASGSLFRDLVYIEPFNFPWNTYDLDVSLANNISDISSPIKSGDTVNILLIQVIEYKRSDLGHCHYYLNPINLDNLDLISYTVK